MSRRAALAWALVVASCAGCPKGKDEVDAGPFDAGPVEAYEKEPNDRPDQAPTISDSTIFHAQLSADPTKPDEDWYQLSSTALRTVDVSVSALAAGDVAIHVMDADRNQLATVNSAGEGKPERLPNLGLNGKVFVRVVSAKKGSGGAYDVTFVFREPTPGMEVEPNDRAVDANAVMLGQPISGYIGHGGDEDWFRFELPAGAEGAGPSVDAGAHLAGGEVDGGVEAEGAADAGATDGPKIALRIELTPVEGVHFEVSVLSAAEAPLFQVKGKDNEALSLRNVGVRAVDHFVYVVVKSAWSGTGKDARRTFNPDRSYQLAVSQEEAGANAEYEPNNEPAKATPLLRDGYREGFLSPKNDVDYYVLRTEQPVLAKVQLSGLERVDHVLSIVKADEKGEQVLMKVNDGTVKEPELLNNVFCAGECLFKVEGALKKVDGKWVKDYENPEVPYRLSVSVVPDDGTEEREPNGTVETATPIAIGKPVRGTVHPKKDVDYYKLDLSGRPVKTPLKVTLTGILKVDVGLYLHALDEDGNLMLQQTADRAKADAPEVIRHTGEPGVVILEVRDAKNRESNFQDAYQLTVEEGE